LKVHEQLAGIVQSANGSLGASRIKWGLPALDFAARQHLIPAATEIAR
jgi:hypothetical protein